MSRQRKYFYILNSSRTFFRKGYSNSPCLEPEFRYATGGQLVAMQSRARHCSALLKITGFDTPARCFTMRSKSHASPPSADRRTFTLFFLEVRRISDCSDFNNPALTWRPKRVLARRVCVCVCDSM